MMTAVKWLLAALTALMWTNASVAQTQDTVVWIQIEAFPSLGTALDRAQAYSQDLEDVNGFALGNGWYAVTLGPYLRPDANQVLRVYRRDGLIPSDSFVAFSDRFEQQFWPIGADVMNRGIVAPPPPDIAASTEPELADAAEDAGASPPAETAEAPPPPPEVPEETRAEAQRSEQQLSRAEKQELQIALQWAGHYNAAIDGLFGRGTRAAMSAWQRANDEEVTGVLTTRQRAALLRQYYAVLDGLDLELYSDAQAGIEILIPRGVVEFDAYDYPFAKFDASGELPVQVLLISQEGDQTRLFGLYDILQTLELVPLEGRRERRRTSFFLTGENDEIVSHTEADLVGGQIKGFTLVWPSGDEERRLRVLDEMRASFKRIDGVLSPEISASNEQAVDLVSGLQVRRPTKSRSGFFVDREGRVLTTSEAVESCTRITLDEDTSAVVEVDNPELGLALLRPETDLAPRAVALFGNQAPRLQSEAVVAGYSFEGVLGAPTVTFGNIADLRGLNGEEDLTRLSVATLPGDTGGPVFDQAGAIIGMLLPAQNSVRQLPEDVSFARNATVLQSLLREAGVEPRTQLGQRPLDPEDITRRARAMTVLVSCWTDS